MEKLSLLDLGGNNKSRHQCRNISIYTLRIRFPCLNEGMVVLDPKLVPVEQGVSSASPDSPQLKKWGVAGRAGFQLVPNVLFRAQQYLGIDPTDVVILLNLTLHWWGPQNLPFPSPQIISQRMGVSRRTIERRLETLERNGLIRRLKPSAPAESTFKVRKFELTGLVQKLEAAALQGLSQRDFVKLQKPVRSTKDHRVAQRIERHKQQRPGLPAKEDNLARVEVGVGGSSPPPVTLYSHATLDGAERPALVADADIPF